MNDRELLECAAKAAGFKRETFVDGKSIIREADGQPVYWNPLTDDGDALRLAVKLRMDVEPWIHGDSACSRVLCQEVLIDEPHYGDDPERATRRAIVRVAAEIGKAM
jgi:hypothetical protein